MPEELKEQEFERPDIRRLVGIIHRRHLFFLIPLLLGWLVVFSFSYFLPPRYKSSTLILVEAPTMPSTYVQPNITDDLQSRIQSMTEQILSRTRLLLIIQKLHLYSDQQGGISDDQKIASMRKDIGIDLVRNPEKHDISAFRVSYSSSDPHIAQQVTAELTGLFISENLKVRQHLAEGTTDFLNKELEDARQSLSEQEAKVRQFQSSHEGALPSQGPSNLQILAGLQSQLQNEQSSLNTARQQRVYLQALLEQERAANRPSAGLGTPADLATIDQQLAKLRSQLTDLESRYTDRYPDVERLRDQITRTESMRASILAAAKAGSSDGAQQDDTTAKDARDTTLSAAGRQLQGQLQANQLEIANHESSITSLKSRINEYQTRLNLTPETEQQLAEMTRGYDQSKANYDDLLKKQQASEMATNMETLQQGERFTTLDPPSLPSKPDFPNRLKFCGMGVGVGLALGFVIAGAFELMDGRLHTEKEIKSLLPIAVIAEIPEVVNRLDERKSKRALALEWATTVLVLGVILAGSLLSYLHN